MKEIDPKRILSAFEIDRSLLLELGEFLRTVDEPTTIFVCSVYGLCISVSQLVIALAFLDIYFKYQLNARLILDPVFEQPNPQKKQYWLNPELIAASLFAEENEEHCQIDLQKDLTFIKPYLKDQ